MTNDTKLKQTIYQKIQEFGGLPLRKAALELFETLGYKSDKTIETNSVQAFRDQFDPEAKLNHPAALIAHWQSADLLFQLTDEELSNTTALFKDDSVRPSLMQSYVFLAIELSANDYSRGKLTGIARQINRIFPMPVMVVIKHFAEGKPVLSIAVINRRQHKRDSEKDVLGKVTIIRNISLVEPHRGHLEILASFALSNLVHPQRLLIDNFDTLHAAWEEIFNVELLNKNFYREISNWFFWAKQYCHFPLYDAQADKYDLFRDSEKVKEHEAKNLIRLLTRTLFVWFIKQRGLVPDALFDPVELQNSILKSFDPESRETIYYKAVLQNLFFATLNQTHKQREFRKEGKHQNITNLLRYEDQLSSPQDFIALLEAHTPFLNGGLFESLDRPHPTKTGPQGGRVIIYEDGFSDRKDNSLTLPDFLFFGASRRVDLSSDDAYGLTNKKSEDVRGLIHILDRYKFTIVENTPIDQEIALDPELLGQVFENLLAAYNQETKTTARKQTGSFYTPRPIVDYMVDESLKAHLHRALVEKAFMPEADAKSGLDLLFTYTEKEHPFNSSEVEALITAIDNCKILDPACGSGAFPMGALQKLVYILSKLDPENHLWKQTQLDKLDSTPMRESLERDFSDNDDDYGRKLYLIENCLYGVDIQSIAIQVSKLRFFISLIVDQNINRDHENFGVRPLPNLETKFVTADTLISIERPNMQMELYETTNSTHLKGKLKKIRHALFSAKTPQTKNKYREEDRKLREDIANELKNNGWQDSDANALAKWDPYDQNASTPYFDPEWMFGETGFDIVIGNPPYIQIQKFPKAQKDLWMKQDYQTFSAMADIYCLFYERGANLLRDGGHLCYITSNKWMRAGYGDKLRDFLATKVNTKVILDFGMAQNFGAATTYTCIVQFDKQPSTHNTLSCYATDDRSAMAEPAAYLLQNGVLQHHLSEAPWVVVSKERQRIKDMVETQGIPLEKWGIQINYGIKTGFNDAFYITQEQRDIFVAKDPRCTELLVPLLRGRHIERYATNWDGAWMINIHNGVREAGIEPIRAQRDYPVLWNHLLQWESELQKRQDKGDHWSNLRNCAYLKEFSKPKIILQEIAVTLPFYYDQSCKMFMDTTCFMITSEAQQLGALCAILNSSVFRCCFRDNFPEYSGNAYRVKKIFLEKIPLKKPSVQQSALFEKLVPLIQVSKRIGADATAQFLEELIDACVMECYFHEHMAERDLLFFDHVSSHITIYNPDTNDDEQRAFLDGLYRTLNAPDSKIRNRLLRLTADSPDLLAVIKEEGKI
jgi:adenine-specific DNA-methyltransferase